MNLRLLLLYGSICLLVLLRVVLTPGPNPLPDGAHIKARVRLTTTPQIVFGKQQLSVTVRGQKITLIVPQYSGYTYGDLIEIDGSLKAKVLDSGKTVYSIYYPKIHLVQNDTALPYRWAGFVRQKVEESYSRFLPADQAGLLMGIVFGINGGVDKDLKTAFQVTGVTHVIAASGMNVTLLAAFLLPILMKFLKRQHSLIVLILVLAFYTVISGMSASIVRATLMASIGFIGLLVGRQRTGFISFFLTGCIMLLITPTIWSDIGFELSFAATAGMLLIRPILPSFSQIPFVSIIEEDFSATIAAQITTLPILIYYFHTLGLLAILVNALVLWTIAPMMVIGSVAAVIGLVSTALGGLISFVCLPLLLYFLFIIRVFASFTPTITLTDLPLILVIGYYLLLSGIILYLVKRKTSSAAKIRKSM
ncbi:hypothetical protein BH09PAT1_BH09PAT1_5670 [soil metagenome]